MVIDITEQWKGLGLHRLQAKKLADLKLKPTDLEEYTLEELDKKYPEWSSNLKEKIHGAIGPVVSISEEDEDPTAKTPSAPVTEPGPTTAEKDPTEPVGEPEPIIEEPKKKPKKKAAKKAEKTPAVRTKKGKELVARAESIIEARSLPASQKRKLLLSQNKPETEAGLVGIASQLKSLEYSFIPTGFTALDSAMGGGWPVGKFSVVYGEEQTCKTTLCLQTIANDHKQNPDSFWLWINSENSLDLTWCAKLGVDLDRLVVVDPMIMEEQVNIAEKYIETGAITGVVVDSVGSWLAWQEVKSKRDDKTYTKGVEEDTMAIVARGLSKILKRTTPLIARTQTAYILISHVYANIGKDAKYKPLMLKGGNALKHFGHMRVFTSRRQADKSHKKQMIMADGRDKEVWTAYEAGFLIDKTRQSATEAYRVFVPFLFGVGISEVESVIEMGLAYGVFHNKGSYYWHESFGEHPGWIQGKEKTFDYVRGNEDIFSRVLDDVGAVLATKLMEEQSDKAVDLSTESVD